MKFSPYNESYENITYSPLVATYSHQIQNAIFTSGSDKNINIEGIASRLLVIGDTALAMGYTEG